jgi:CIC family chloride channel protein
MTDDGIPSFTNPTLADLMEAEERPPLSLTQLSLLALVLGVITGLGAVLFRDLIGLIHNLAFTGHAVVHYDANVFTAPAPWGALVILVPVLGAIGRDFPGHSFCARGQRVMASQR